MKPILYSSKTCAPCKMTKMFLERKGVKYEERDTADPAYQQEAIERSGVTMVPVLVYGDQVVTGYNPGRLASLF